MYFTVQTITITQFQDNNNKKIGYSFLNIRLRLRTFCPKYFSMNSGLHRTHKMRYRKCGYQCVTFAHCSETLMRFSNVLLRPIKQLIVTCFFKSFFLSWKKLLFHNLRINNTIILDFFGRSQVANANTIHSCNSLYMKR